MEKKKYVLLPILIVCFLISGGCGSTGKTAKAIQNIDTQTADDNIFDYEIRELSAQRDGNHIYGVAYIPLDAGGQMPTVIYAHGYGVTHQNGIQYAEKLAEHGYVVYCFDFCGGGNGSQSDGSPLEMSVFTEQADLEAVIGMIRELDYYPSAELKVLPGAGHGLHGQDAETATEYILEYLQAHCQ